MYDYDEIQARIEEARRLRSQAVGELLSKAYAGVKALVLKFAANLHPLTKLKPRRRNEWPA